MALDRSGNQSITVALIGAFARKARNGLRLERTAIGGITCAPFPNGVEVGDTEVNIMGSKWELLRTLMAASAGKSATFIVLY